MEEDEAVPWVEKYRPRLLSDVLGSDDALKRLTVLAAEGNVPNLLFAVRGSWVIAAAMTPGLSPWCGCMLFCCRALLVLGKRPA
jgi:hypothetical protein